MCAARGGEYREQDYQILARGKRPRAHIQERWDERCPDGWEGYNVRAAWREADPAGWRGNGRYAREHPETGLLIIAQYGTFMTVYRTQRTRAIDRQTTDEDHA